MVDASVALALVWQEAHSAAADRLFGAGRSHAIQLIAPEFWLVECANGCWNRVQRGWISAEDARTAYRAMADLAVVRIDVAGLSEFVLDVAIENAATSYDALYIATAQFANAPLITTDAKLLDDLRLAHWPGRALHLSEFT